MHLKASGERDQEAVGDVALGQADLTGEGSIDVHIDLRIIKHLLDAQVGNAGNQADALEQVRGVSVIGLLVMTDDLHIDGCRQAEIEDLGDDVGRQERKRGAWELLWQSGAQLLDEVRGRSVALLEADQGVAVLGSDRAGVLVGHVNAGKRQPDIVDDVVELIGRDGLADSLFDQVEQARGFLDTRAGLGAHVHQDLSGIDRRKEVLAEERPQSERQKHARKEAGDESLWAIKREQQ